MNAFLAVGVEVAVRVVPLRRLAPVLGLSLDFDAGDLPEGGPPTPPFAASERRQLKAVLRVMRYWPFGRGACLRQSLLVGLHLRHRRPRLRLGVRSRSGSIDAHAWVEVSGTLIGGDRSFIPLLEDGGRPRSDGGPAHSG